MSGFRSIDFIATTKRPLTESELESLLVEAMQINKSNGITGVLLYCNGVFMEFIEGEEDSVMATYKRIRYSTKLDDVVVLLHEATDTRQFQDWKMGILNAVCADRLARSTAEWERMIMDQQLPENNSEGFHLLRNFWQQSAQDVEMSVSDEAMA